MNKLTKISLAIATVIAATSTLAAVPHTFSAGQKAKASEVNANFEALDQAITTLKNESKAKLDLADLALKSGFIKAVRGADHSKPACQAIRNGAATAEGCDVNNYTEQSSVEGDYSLKTIIYKKNVDDASDDWQRVEFYKTATGVLEKIEQGPVGADPVMVSTLAWQQSRPQGEISPGDSWHQSATVTTEASWDPEPFNVSEVITFVGYISYKLPNGEIISDCALFTSSGFDLFGGYSNAQSISCPGAGEIRYLNDNWYSNALSITENE